MSTLNLNYLILKNYLKLENGQMSSLPLLLFYFFFNFRDSKQFIPQVAKKLHPTSKPFIDEFLYSL